jgi:hypothetical protein
MSFPNKKTRRMNRMKYLEPAIFGMATLVVLFVLWITGYWFNDWLLKLALAMGVANLGVAAVFYIQYRLSPDVPRADERTQTLSMTAIMFSWLLSLGFVGVLGLLAYMGMVNISAWHALGSTSLFMVASAILLNLLFRLRSAQVAKEDEKELT